MKKLMRGWAHGYIEYALDFAAAGLYEEALSLLECYVTGVTEVYPVVYYTMGYFHTCKGDESKALEYYQRAEKENHSYCFPNRIEEVLILQDAVRLNIHGAKAAI